MRISGEKCLLLLPCLVALEAVLSADNAIARRQSPGELPCPPEPASALKSWACLLALVFFAMGLIVSPLGAQTSGPCSWRGGLPCSGWLAQPAGSSPAQLSAGTKISEDSRRAIGETNRRTRAPQGPAIWPWGSGGGP